ncbi:hypothetical protein CROQUDRAFT_719164 [Cronartium quercuum f. sp. fusiforme G11]|uniref:Rho-GAP domain-containing protein n=1 Tax=Cronartium quercuum f. sp. fusiforme G11 TaxID=708437 RepID=A0A9P6NVD5_9BASI|nr:hypothetical protein CROQUDRAFT_719164 [Cronartium quercuum f. sp. fusiforme G11]
MVVSDGGGGGGGGGDGTEMIAPITLPSSSSSLLTSESPPSLSTNHSSSSSSSSSPPTSASFCPPQPHSLYSHLSAPSATSLPLHHYPSLTTKQHRSSFHALSSLHQTPRRSSTFSLGPQLLLVTDSLSSDETPKPNPKPFFKSIQLRAKTSNLFAKLKNRPISMGLSKGIAQRWHNQSSASSSPSTSTPHTAQPAFSTHEPPPSLHRHGRSFDQSNSHVNPSSLKLPSTILGVKVPNRRGLAFGLPLSVSLHRLEPSSSKQPESHRWLPAIAIRCLEYLNTRGPGEEGIYRIPGRSTDVEKLRVLFDAGCDIDLLKQTIGTLDPHAVASTFKLWLREVPESLLSPEFDNEINRIVNQYSGLVGMPPPLPATMPAQQEAVEECARKLANIFPRLPPPNWHLLRAIADHLSILSQSSSTNRMTLTNLRLILSPTLKFTPVLLQILVEQRQTLFDQPCVWTGPPRLNKTSVKPASSPQLTTLAAGSASSVPRQIPSPGSTAEQFLASRLPVTGYFALQPRPQTSATDITPPVRSRLQSCAEPAPTLPIDVLSSLPTITSSHWAFEDSLSQFMIKTSPPLPPLSNPQPTASAPFPRHEPPLKTPNTDSFRPTPASAPPAAFFSRSNHPGPLAFSISGRSGSVASLGTTNSKTPIADLFKRPSMLFDSSPTSSSPSFKDQSEPLPPLIPKPYIFSRSGRSGTSFGSRDTPQPIHKRRPSEVATSTMNSHSDQMSGEGGESVTSTSSASSVLLLSSHLEEEEENRLSIDLGNSTTGRPRTTTDERKASNRASTMTVLGDGAQWEWGAGFGFGEQNSRKSVEEEEVER